jgi:DNA-binding PadR family transcriptional regulator
MSASTLVTERDERILDFVAEHRIVLASHVQELLEVSESVAYRRLRGLTERGLLAYSQVLHGRPGWYRITREGLAMIDSDLRPPRTDLRCYRHDIGIAWVWLAAARGAFGRVEKIVSEREMRSRDAVGAAADRAAAVRGERALDLDDDGRPRYGVHLGGVGPRGQNRLHYPDLLLIGRAGERVAVELERTAKGGRRLETILAGYGAEPSLAAVLYLTEKPRVEREVRAAAARLGISDLVHVHPIAWQPGAEPSPAVPQGRTRPAVARDAGRGGGTSVVAGARRGGGTSVAPGPSPALHSRRDLAR